MATQTQTFTLPSLELEDLGQLETDIVTSLAPVPKDAVYNSLPGLNRDSAINEQFLPRNRAIVVIVQLAGLNFLNSFTNGLVTVGLPRIAEQLDIHNNLLLWPMSAYALTNASCLLLGGAIADVVGTKRLNIVGCFFSAVFILLCGISQNGKELIIFRAMQGIASAMALPTAMSIVSRAITSGRPRNIAFGTIGLAMPLGYSFGMVLGGVFVSGPGWRVGFYVGGAASFLLLTLGIWALPREHFVSTQATIWRRLRHNVDWIGTAMASTSIAMFSYVLAMLAANIHLINRAETITLLILSIILASSFIWWMRHQEQLGRPALIPNSLWKKTTFTTISLMVLIVYAVVNCIEIFSSLYFQRVQHNSALEASLKILPNMVFGIFLNFTTGVFVNRLPAIYVVVVSSVLSAGAPVLMALINPKWPYWYDAFFAQLLSPVSVDVLFTVGMLIISDVFPPETQALAGAVFNTLAQLGTSIGLTVMSLISATVIDSSRISNKASPQALLEGYRASFWTMFALMVTACLIGVLGLRRTGIIGVKRD